MCAASQFVSPDSDCGCSAKTVLMALLAVSIFHAAEAIGAEPLLSCVIAGIIITNRRHVVSETCSRLLTQLLLCREPDDLSWHAASCCCGCAQSAAHLLQNVDASWPPVNTTCQRLASCHTEKRRAFTSRQGNSAGCTTLFPLSLTKFNSLS